MAWRGLAGRHFLFHLRAGPVRRVPDNLLVNPITDLDHAPLGAADPGRGRGAAEPGRYALFEVGGSTATTPPTARTRSRPAARGQSNRATGAAPARSTPSTPRATPGGAGSLRRAGRQPAGHADAPAGTTPAIPAACAWGRTCSPLRRVHPRCCAWSSRGRPASRSSRRIPAAARDGKARPALKLSAFQPVERDFAFLVDRDLPAEKLIRAAKGADKALVAAVRLFDAYEGKGVEDGKKSLAIAVTLQPRARTLTDAEIDAVAAKIVAQVEKATGGTLRG